MSNLKENGSIVYLIKDKSMKGYYKIGVTIDKTNREKTLQAEKPCIVVIAYKLFSSRELAFRAERDLHLKYKRHKLRGEWFELNGNEISDILEFFMSDSEKLWDRENELDVLKAKNKELSELVSDYKSIIDSKKDVNIEDYRQIAETFETMLKSSLIDSESDKLYYSKIASAYRNLFNAFNDVDLLKKESEIKLTEAETEKKEVMSMIEDCETALSVLDENTNKVSFDILSNVLESNRAVLKRLN